MRWWPGNRANPREGVACKRGARSGGGCLFSWSDRDFFHLLLLLAREIFATEDDRWKGVMRVRVRDEDAGVGVAESRPFVKFVSSSRAYSSTARTPRFTGPVRQPFPGIIDDSPLNSSLTSSSSPSTSACRQNTSLGFCRRQLFCGFWGPPTRVT